MKKVLAILLIAVLTLGMFAGCSDKKTPADTSSASQKTTDDTTTEDTAAVSADSDTPLWKQNADQPIDFSWYINFSWFSGKWGQDLTSQYITDKTGVNIEYIVPAGNEAEKLNTMIASDTLPDLLSLGWYEYQVDQIVTAQLVHPLTQLAEEHDPGFLAVASQEKLDWYAQPDGETYGYPNASYSPEDFEKYHSSLSSNQTFLVRKDIYEAIGSPDMSTQQGFLDALTKAKEQFPEVGGQPLIPFGLDGFTDTGNGSLEGYLQNFLAVPYEKDGKIYDRTTDPEYIAWLKTLRTANEEGLLSKDIFIDSRTQLEEKVAQGRYFALLFQAIDIQHQNLSLYTSDPDSAYIAVDGPKNQAGDPHTLNGESIAGWTLSMISKNCSDPARAIQLFTYFLSEEGQHDIKLGPDEFWETVDGKDQLKDEYLQIKAEDGDVWGQEYGADDSHWMLMDTAMQTQWEIPLNEPYKSCAEWTTPYVSYNGVYDGIDPDTDTEEAKNLTKIDNKWGSILPKLLMADSEGEFDALMEEFTAYRDDNGFDAIQEIKDQKLAENKAKLGIN